MKNPEKHLKRWGKISLIVTVLAFIAQIVYLITRWIGTGHIPVSNMYEFMSFLAIMIIGAYLAMYAMYRYLVLGAFAVPLAGIVMAYASVFPSEVQPLIPQLDSIWLYIHVTLAALSEAFFAIGAIAGFIYLLRTMKWEDPSKKLAQRSLEAVMVLVVVILGFVIAIFSFRLGGYEVAMKQQFDTVDKVDKGKINSTIETVTYTLPPLIAPHHYVEEAELSIIGIPLPLVESPAWLDGGSAARKLNTVAWSIISGLLLYGILRLIARKPLTKAIQPMLRGIDPEDLDELSYRANAIGFPLFTLGGLIFAMIWAHYAWSRFWGWDPKEVWALITWLFYSVYLHLRLARGYHGAKSSWLSVIGFIIIMFTLLGVNLIISGLHSYAGV